MSAEVLATSVAYRTWQHQPLTISKHHMFISVPDHDSFPPRHLCVHCTADILIPRISTLPTTKQGPSCLTTVGPKLQLPSPSTQGHSLTGNLYRSHDYTNATSRRYRNHFMPGFKVLASYSSPRRVRHHSATMERQKYDYTYIYIYTSLFL